MQHIARHRPSGPMAVSLLALFIALGGVAWGATQLPANSVGRVQLQNGAVTAGKLAKHTVGAGQVKISQVQLRIGGRCASGAVTAIDRQGGVRCNESLPRSFGERSQPVAIGDSSTDVVSKSLPPGAPYVVFGSPYALIASSSAPQQVLVTCTLAAGGHSQTRSLSVIVTAPGVPIDEAIPLSVTAPRSGSASTASIGCSKHTSSGSSPGVAVVAGIDAIEVSSIG